jgi:pimeloyl-ACP methyl ester carboxylesterase
MTPSLTPTWTQTWLTASDGVQLAVYTTGPDDAPPIVLVHGYPDDHSVWNPVATELARDFHVVAYDVRGAGASDVPAARDAYRVDQLADDLGLVAATTGEEPVHLLAHDWGSIQAWHAATGDNAPARYASLTSVSGPDRAYAAAWLARGWRTNRTAVLKQAASSWYVGMFLLPVVPNLLWTSGLGRRLLPTSAPARSIPDAVHGLSLYRANFGSRHQGRPRPCLIPVQVLAPRHDEYLTHAFVTQAPQPYVRDLRVSQIEGGHWGFRAHPERVVEPVRAFLAELADD